MKHPTIGTLNLDQAIRQHRTTHATVTLTHRGSPLINQEVVVKQLKHRFLFGSNWGESTIALAIGGTGRRRERTGRAAQ